MHESAGEQSLAIRPGDRIVVVANPAIRSDVRDYFAALQRAAPDDVTIDAQITTHAGAARELARAHAPGARLLVAIGGDGTVGDVATAAVEHDVPIAIMPGGSTNIVAKDLGIPADPDAGARLIFGRHRVARIDAGRRGDRVFLHMVGAGFDSRFFARSNPVLKRKVGWLAYLPAAARTVLDAPFAARVVVDGEEVRTTTQMVLVANGDSIIHSAMRIAPGVSKTDGVLDVFVVTARTGREKAEVIGQLLRRQVDESPHVIRLRGREIEIETDPPMPVQLDGDVDGQTPARISMLPRALQVVVPPTT